MGGVDENNCKERYTLGGKLNRRWDGLGRDGLVGVGW